MPGKGIVRGDNANGFMSSGHPGQDNATRLHQTLCRCLCYVADQRGRRPGLPPTYIESSGQKAQLILQAFIYSIRFFYKKKSSLEICSSV